MTRDYAENQPGRLTMSYNCRRFFRFLKQHFEDFTEECRMYRVLRAAVDKDCRGQLLYELLLEPSNLRARYEEEMKFRDAMGSRWKK